MTECPHCHHPLNGEVRCPGCGADMAPAEPGGPVNLDTRSLVLWGLIFIPGVAAVLVGLATSTWPLAAIGIALALIPLGLQLFGADWGNLS